MRTTDDELKEILKRADALKERVPSRRGVLSSALAACACAALLVLTSYFLPRIPEAAAEELPDRYGSLLLSVPYIGYVIIGILCFALGVCVTLFCIRLRRLKKKGERP